MLRSTAIVRLNCGSSVISSFYLLQCIDCVLNLLLNERHCLVPAKQGVYAILYNELCKTRVLIGLEECVIRV